MNRQAVIVVTALASLAALAAAPPSRNVPGVPAPVTSAAGMGQELFPGLTARSIGPATMGGRITAIAVVESRPATQYIGAASGGVWKTTDDGLTWSPVFDGRPNASIGAIAIAPSDPNVVWVGTGEANARNSVCWGNGVFVSRDAGKTWQHVGLADTHHIGRIVVHPHNPDRAYVAALGRLWAPRPRRGLFRTLDGGKTWQEVLRLDNETGCVDVAMDPADPRTLYAAAYRVRRDAFSGGNPAIQFGPLAGIYRTRDGGTTWKRLTKGLPTRQMGRIGLAIYRKDPRIVFAVVPTDRTDIRQVAGQAPGNRTGVETGGIFRSHDGGDSWMKINDLCPRPFYFGQIRVDPADAQRLWVLGIPLFFSRDGGKTFSPRGAREAHVDHHDLWINPADPRHQLLATDGGLYRSLDGGAKWSAVHNLPIAQFYGIAVDMRTPYHIYGGLQDNGSWQGPSRTSNPAGILNRDWTRILSFDGFQCQIAPDDPNTVYAEGQYGRLHRVDLRTRKSVSVQPRRRADTPAFRFNWNAPILASAHGPRTLYFGGNYLFKSTDTGNTWRILGPDLTGGSPSRTADYGHTLTTIAESPLKAGILYTGSDDGKVHVSRDDGRMWTDISNRLPGVPAGRSISRISCSPFAPGTAWLSLTRYRHNDFAPYLFRTDDFGLTWKPLAANLPADAPVHVVRPDPRNADLLYAGTEFGLLMSLDAGKSWQPLTAGLPSAPIQDLVVHPRDRELVVATHGRGLFIIDVAPLQELTAKVRATKAHLFDPRVVPLLPRGPLESPPARTYAGTNPPEGLVIYYRLAQKQLAASLQVQSADGRVLALLPVPPDAGLHRVVWKPERMVPGDYTVRLSVAGEVSVKKVRFERQSVEVAE